MNQINILLVEDNPGDVELIREMLLYIDSSPSSVRLAFPRILLHFDNVNSVAGAIEYIASANNLNCILLDLGLPDSQGIETLNAIYIVAPHIPIIVMTGESESDCVFATSLIKAGAQDYLIKGYLNNNNNDLLLRSICYAIERKHIEDMLLQSEIRYSQILNAVNDGFWDWNVLSGNAFFSSIYYSILGYNNNEFIANYDSWKALVHPEDINYVEKELQLCIKNGKGFSIDLRMKMKSGDWKWVLIRGKVIELDAENKVMRMIGTLSDISERKKSEEALVLEIIKRQKAEESLQNSFNRVQNLISQLLEESNKNNKYPW